MNSLDKGYYIVFEGVEGSGKSTQLEVLAKYLTSAGFPVRQFREPDSQSHITARAIRRITQDQRYPLNTKSEVLLYNAARALSLDVISDCRKNGIICLVDRNYLTTLAVQYHASDQEIDYDRLNDIIDFAVGDIHPDLTIVLDAEIQTILNRTDKRGRKERFDDRGIEFYEKVRAGYLHEAKARDLPVIHSMGTVEDTFKQVWVLVSELLSGERVSGQSVKNAQAEVSIQSTAEILSEKLLTKKNDVIQMTKLGEALLSESVTNTRDNVYAFTEKISPMTVAAAMARLSRRGDDMRITLLDEFMGEAGKDTKLLQRVITAYGDDSVQQLVGQHVVVEGASNLLTKKLEWGRLAAYLEQSTRYIYFDQKDVDGKYKYYVPPHFDKKTKAKYVKIMDEIFVKYSAMVRKLTTHVQTKSGVPKKEQDIAWRGATRAQACDAIRAVLPVATKSTVGIYASGQALESLIMHLQSDELKEANDTGDKLLAETRKTIPTFLERADKPDRGGAQIAYKATTSKTMRTLADKHLPDTYSLDFDPVKLTNVWPHNELDLVPDMLYEHTSHSHEQIRSEVTAWPYDKKVKVFDAYMGERLNRRHRPGRALENAHYSFDLVCDYGIFRDLQRHRMVDDLAWQELTPRYGFEVPQLVIEAGLSDDFESCFDLSLGLYSDLQSAGYSNDAQYATLLGHRMRWKVTMNAREAFHFIELRTSPQGHPGYRKLTQQMFDKIAEVHPMMAGAMKFVNQGEDPELARLAAEKYTQFKLNQIK